MTKEPREPKGLSNPDTKAGRLQRACLNQLQQHERDNALPTNNTFLFYELEQQGVIPKHYRNEDGIKRARTPRQDVSDATMRLRELGLVPWWWLVDESRTFDEWQSAPSVYDYAVEAIKRARIDCWGGKPAPLILCEARSMKGVLSRLTARYLAPIGATGGQSGGYLVNDIAPPLTGNSRPVLYIGDHELRGPADQIEANARRYLEEHARRTFDERTWIRVALTTTQVDDDKRLLDLVTTKLDRRYKPPREYQAVECEAVGQTTLVGMLRAQLDAMLPEPLEPVLVREKRQRERIAALLQQKRNRR
jgi:hypothetical protein